MDTLLRHGTTTAEAKSGYGLTLEDELKQLRAIRRAGEGHAVDLVPTLLAAHEDAQQILGVLETFVRDPGNRVLTAAELGPGQLYLSAAGSERGLRFARATLGPLLDMSDPSMADLLTTVAAFQAGSHNVTRAADILGVHRNTIRHRLGRIRELTGLDLAEDVQAQVAAHMSLVILGLAGEHGAR